VARATGLEPATSGVTGRHSNRLSYARASDRRSGEWVRFKRHPDPCQAFRSTIFEKGPKTFAIPMKPDGFHPRLFGGYGLARSFQRAQHPVALDQIFEGALEFPQSILGKGVVRLVPIGLVIHEGRHILIL
jgi:hypothetical protein